MILTVIKLETGLFQFLRLFKDRRIFKYFTDLASDKLRKEVVPVFQFNLCIL